MHAKDPCCQLPCTLAELKVGAEKVDACMLRLEDKYKTQAVCSPLPDLH